LRQQLAIANHSQVTEISQIDRTDHSTVSGRTADPRQNSSPLIFRIDASHHRCMLELLLVVARARALALRGHRELVLENLALRQQLTAMKRSANRPRLERGARLFWIALARVWQNWRTALVVVQPDTVVRWHRDWLRRRWIRRSKRRPGGRPPLDQQIRVLVGDMATANPLWGAPRIHGELRTLGVDVSERTVSRLLRRYPRLSSQTWKTFLTNHLASAASMDFFTVTDAHGPRAVRANRARASSPARRASQHHGSSDSRLVRSASGRCISG
jgi:hypothetical protein